MRAAEDPTASQPKSWPPLLPRSTPPPLESLTLSRRVRHRRSPLSSPPSASRSRPRSLTSSPLAAASPLSLALLEEDTALKRFKSYKNRVKYVSKGWEYSYLHCPYCLRLWDRYTGQNFKMKESAVAYS
uniref:Uncharacterized protein n=1 Tax=Oryza punctata TaxID=4537 RepID=A0A0E0KGJ9_ORYPU